MIPESILFFWSKGAETRRRIILFVLKMEQEKKPAYLNVIAQELGLTHTAVKKHIDLLLECMFMEQINPLGKPVYLKLTTEGAQAAKKF